MGADWEVLIIFAAETWPFLVKLLIQCVSLEISGSKRRLPKSIFAKTLRIVIQRAEDSKFSGNFLKISVINSFTLKCCFMRNESHGHLTLHCNLAWELWPMIFFSYFVLIWISPYWMLFEIIFKIRGMREWGIPGETLFCLDCGCYAFFFFSKSKHMYNVYDTKEVFALIQKYLQIS